MSFRKYPIYKDSGVSWIGAVPEDWEVVPLKAAIARIESGTSVNAVDIPVEGTQFGVLKTSCVYTGQFAASENKAVVAAEYDRVTCPVKADTLIVSRMNTPDLVGAAGLSKHEHPNLFLPDRLWQVYPRGPCVKYMHYWTRTVEYRAEVEMACAGTSSSMQNLAQNDFRAFKFPKPPVSEQMAIAAFLDKETAKIDALVEDQQRLIELLKEKRVAVISQAVTKGLNPNAPMKESGDQWIGPVPKHWTLMKLKHAKSRAKNAFVDGPFGSNLKSEHFINDGDVYVIESGFATQGRLNLDDLKTISAEHFATIDRSETRGGDIIIAKIGAQFGKSSILPTLNKPAVVSGNSLKMTVDSKAFDVNFVNWQLVNLKALGAIEDIVNATAQPALSLGEMSNLPFVAPPKAEQQAIVSYLVASLGELDGLMTEAQLGIDLLQERRSALISATVTGKIDVRDLAPQSEAVAA